MASTFKFLFRPPYIRPDVLKLGDDGDLLACGGIDGRLNVFSLVRGIHLTTMVFPAPISVLTWEPTTLADIWKLWVGMRDGSVNIISIANIAPTPVLKVAGGDPIIQITSKATAVMVTTSSGRKILMDKTSWVPWSVIKDLDRWMATIHLQSNPGKDASAGGPIIRTNFGAPERERTGQTIRITEGVMLTARRDQIPRRSTFSRVGHNKERMRLRNRGPRCRGRCRKAKECRHKHGKL
ncbi:hypothetical protein B0H14DRAFT_3031216 [Mycena olivaceomarginata]|nr:hypothetical protein B0H14DRAFT_3031216 [Mycena olivaceomarginata]